MHGIIFLELKKYADSKFGGATWLELLKDAGFGTDRVYLPIQEYPDAEALAIIDSASRLSGVEAQAILEDFGAFIVPDLVQVYRSLIQAKWRTLDVIEHTERMIHRVVRIKNPGAKPPALQCDRTGPNEVIVTYTSHRKMCALARGIVRGLARHYHEEVAITDRSCMLHGDPTCKIAVRLVTAHP